MKIDRSFVASLDEDRQVPALLGAIIAIAEALDLELIAEGVETLDQLEALSDMSCQVR